MTSTFITSFKLYKSKRAIDRLKTKYAFRRAHRDMSVALNTAGSLWGEVEFAG